MMREWRSPGTPDDEQLVAGYMQRLAKLAPDATPRLPDAPVVWAKAQLLRHWEAERKAQAPLDLMEPVQIAAALTAAAVLLIWSLPSLMEALGGLLPG